MSLNEVKNIELYLNELNNLEQKNPAKFNEVMNELEAHVKQEASEKGITIDEEYAEECNKLLIREQLHANKAPTGVALPDLEHELSIDGDLGIRQKDDGIWVIPKAGFVIKTTAKSRDSFVEKRFKVFINVCSSEHIEKPGEKTRLDDEGKEVSGMNIPISVGPVRPCKDKKGQSSVAVDCIVNPKVIDDIKLDSGGSFRDFVCQMMLSYVESKYSNKFASVSRQYGLPKMKYHAYVHSDTGELVSHLNKFASLVKQRVKSKRAPTIEEIKPTAHRKPSQTSEVSLNGDNTVSSMAQNELNICTECQLEEGSAVKLADLIAYYRGNDDTLSLIEEYAPMDDRGLKHPIITDVPQFNGLRIEKLRIITTGSVIHSTFSLKDIKVQVSAWMCFLSIKGYQPSEIIFPFCIDTSTAKCHYDRCTLSLVITAELEGNNLFNEPDIGSRPWTLAKGLERKTKKSAVSSKDRTVSSSSDRCKLFTETFENNRNDSVVEIDSLPEDKFHAADAYSQCILEKQRQERSEKANDKSRPKSGHQDGIEYLDIADFQPGGKHFDKESEDVSYRNHGYASQSKGSVRWKTGSAIKNNLWTELL